MPRSAELLLWQGQTWENAGTRDFMERFEDFGLKIGIHGCLNEYMEICEYKRSRSFFDLSSRTFKV